MSLAKQILESYPKKNPMWQKPSTPKQPMRTGSDIPSPDAAAKEHLFVLLDNLIDGKNLRREEAWDRVNAAIKRVRASKSLVEVDFDDVYLISRFLKRTLISIVEVAERAKSER